MTKASPGSDDAARELGLSALRTGRIQEAITRFEQLDRVSGISRDWPEFINVLTLAYEAKGGLDRAMDFARRSRANDTTWASLLALAWVAAGQGNTSLALALADTMAQRFPEEPVQYRIGVRLNSIGQRDEAIKLWRLGANAPIGGFYRAMSMYYAGDYEPAAVLLDSIGNPPDPTRRPLGLRGMVAARRGNEAYARAVLDSLKKEAPLASARWQARLHAVLGERDAAVKQIGHAIFDSNLEILNRYDPDFLPLAGYPPFEQAMRPRR